jgi:16S rRNA (guanine527-N7)-methyltransferase
LDIKSFLKSGAALFGITLTEKQAVQFLAYMNNLQDWNEKINLTAIKLPEDVAAKHFLDSLSVSVAFPQGYVPEKWVDVGAGAGFPGLPLKIVYPDIHLTAMDALKKRVNFLAQLVDVLGLEGVMPVHMRAEDAAVTPAHAEQYDVCMARAVADLAHLAVYCLPLVKPGGVWIAMKGPKPQAELLAAQKVIEDLGGAVKDVKTVRIPTVVKEIELEHTLIIVNKLRSVSTMAVKKIIKAQKSTRR